MDKQWRVLILAILMCCMIIPMATVQMVNADEEVEVYLYCEFCGKNHKTENGLLEELLKWKLESETVNPFKDRKNSGFTVSSMLEFNVEQKDSVFYNLWYGKTADSMSVQSINKAMIPLALLMAVIFFFIELSEKVFSDQFSAEQLLLSFVRLGLVMLVAANSFQILTLVAQFGTVVYQLMVKASDALKQDNVGSCVYATYASLNLVEILGSFFDTVTKYIVAVVVYILVVVTMWRRVFDLVIYSMFFPIGIADIVKGGLDSSGVRFIKVIGAKFLQGGIIVGIMIGYNLVYDAISSSSAMGSPLGALIISLTILTLTLNSGNLANSILGV